MISRLSSPALGAAFTLLTGLALLLAVPAAQANQASEDADSVESCMRDAWPRDPRTLCVGIVSTPCQLALGGDSTQAMNACLTREARAWDMVMTRQIPELMRRANEIDAAAAGAMQGIDSAASALENAQRAWLIYRDSECRSAYASWGTGSFRTVAHAACMLDLTARRVVDFQARLVTGG